MADEFSKKVSLVTDKRHFLGVSQKSPTIALYSFRLSKDIVEMENRLNVRLACNQQKRRRELPQKLAE